MPATPVRRDKERSKDGPRERCGGKTKADKRRQRAAETPTGRGRGAETLETKQGRSEWPSAGVGAAAGGWAGLSRGD